MNARQAAVTAIANIKSLKPNIMSCATNLQGQRQVITCVLTFNVKVQTATICIIYVYT